ncbi:MAG: methyltransferase domain-containing protein [Chlorobiaceae bacterium]|nr:methyltransferase domain-containing protein [Chlorobiaceae bacterium]
MKYVHGYHEREKIRLQDQASTLAELLHSDTAYPAGSSVLEAGCGVGAQTVTLVKNSPHAFITSVDISEHSVAEAKANIERAGYTNVTFQQEDIFNLPFEPESFDHIFVCFVLEHLSRPVEALQRLGAFLKPEGTITVIEGDHGSTCFYPDNADSHKAIECLIELQKRAGGNANIGRELYPLLLSAGFEAIHVSPRMVYVDSSRPQLVEGFIENTFTAMIEGVREPSVSAGLIDRKTFDDGIRGLRRTSGDDGVFCYTFFKAVAGKSPGTGRAAI